jgi:hypothetical protein
LGRGGLVIPREKGGDELEERKGWFEIRPHNEAIQVVIFVFSEDRDEDEYYGDIVMEILSNDCDPETYFISAVTVSTPWIPVHREVMTMIFERVCSKDPEQVGEVIDLLRPFLYEGKPKAKS